MVFSKLIVFLVLLNFLNSQMVTCYLCLYDMISVIIPDSSVFALNFPRSLQALMLLSCFFLPLMEKVSLESASTCLQPRLKAAFLS